MQNKRSCRLVLRTRAITGFGWGQLIPADDAAGVSILNLIFFALRNEIKFVELCQNVLKSERREGREEGAFGVSCVLLCWKTNELLT